MLLHFFCHPRPVIALQLQPGQVQNIRLASTGFYNGYSSMTFAWDRPNDGNNAGVHSCIKAYNVEVFRVSFPPFFSQGLLVATCNSIIGCTTYFQKHCEDLQAEPVVIVQSSG
jgi:hypothetical protein